MKSNNPSIVTSNKSNIPNKFSNSSDKLSSTIPEHIGCENIKIVSSKIFFGIGRQLLRKITSKYLLFVQQVILSNKYSYLLLTKGGVPKIMVGKMNKKLNNIHSNIVSLARKSSFICLIPFHTQIQTNLVTVTIKIMKIRNQIVITFKIK